MADEIARTLEETGFPIRAGVETVRDISRSNEPVVYLAETSRDLENKRENILRDLLERGFFVLPSNNDIKPKTTEEYKVFARENLQKCHLSVHLIGKNYGDCPIDGNQSYLHLQLLVAAE